jgi:PAS domain S-box-containing protein
VPIPVRILIVEDTPDDADLMISRLTDEGFQPDWMRVQTEAEYQAALATSPDLILAGWSLPQFSGPRALQLMRSAGLDIPFVIISNSIGEETAVDALHQGAYDYVLKDRPARLGAAVHRALAEKQLREERQRMDEARRQSEDQSEYRSGAEMATDAMITADTDGRIVAWNRAAQQIFQYTRAEALGQSLSLLMPERYRTEHSTAMARVGAGGEPRVIGQVDLHGRRKDGTEFPIELSVATWKTQQGRFYSAILRDISGRKQAEDASRESERLFREMLERVRLIAVGLDTSGNVTFCNDFVLSLTGWQRDEVIGKNWFEHFLPDEVRDQTRQLFLTSIRTGSFPPHFENEIQTRQGARRLIRWSNRVLRDPHGAVSGTSSIGDDITEHKQAEDRIRRQLEHLTALREIDRVITASFDLHLSLEMILTQVIARLGVTAASVLMFNTTSQVLEFAAGRGFHTKAIERTRLRLGEGHAGRAALDLRLVQVSNLREPDNQLITPFLAEEGFVSYFGVPLIAKGEVKGVLEIFHAAPLDPDEEWLDFLNALAGQTAIAIDNAKLFGALQRSKIELTMAYDATIEGWSRALDLRDKETEGHTQRVTDMTIKLARAFGLSEDELMRVRWGALLHDIGKMGIPDGILLKPGPLTDEEWAVIKQHPSIAYEILSPIRYLRAALDIPYYHHEWWDGTGYPLGLRGEQIPLAARIFAVVDVWDALRSDRPYRSAWLHQAVVECLRTQAGTHFDPQVVPVFLQLLATDDVSMYEAKAQLSKTKE